MNPSLRVRPALAVVTALTFSLFGPAIAGPQGADSPDSASAVSSEKTSSPCRKPPASETATSSDAPTCKPAPAESTASGTPAAKVVGARSPEHPIEMNISEPLRKIVSYMGDRLLAGASPGFSEDELIANTDVTAAEYATLRREGQLEMPILRTALYAVLGNRGIDACAAGGATNCAALDACSIDGNLAGSNGAELAKYEQEKNMDGTVYADWVASDFTLPTTGGSEISLSDYRGRPVAVVFLAGHCSHSLNTLPMLDALQMKYAADDLMILPIYVNSGSVEDVRSWSSILELDIDLAVVDNPALAREFESFLVPSTLLIDGSGNITKKLVGYKEPEDLDAAFGELVELSKGSSPQVAAATRPVASATSSR